MVDLKLAANADDATFWAQFNTDALTANRTVTVPNTNITLVGTDATQILQNKTIENLILQDNTDNTKKVNFSTANQNTLSNQTFEFPPTNLLNTGSGNNVITTANATQELKNKTLFTPVIKQEGQVGAVQFNIENITATRVIKFPNADATLLSTDNVTLDDVNFGAGIGASNLTGQTRLQQFFYAGF